MSRDRQPPGDKILISTEMSCHFIHLLQVLIFFNDLIHEGPAQRQIDPRGLNFGVNRKALSLFPFVASFKEISLKSDFIQLFS